MKIIPAIDLIDGKIVRLSKGNPETSKFYVHFGDPVTVAKKWEKEGADAIHIIDLDAALDKGNNAEILEQVVYSVNTPIHVGGGIRKLATAKTLLEMGVNRVILGSLAFNNPFAITKLLDDYGTKRVIVALDHRGGIVMAKGWKTSTNLSVETALKRFLKLGVKLFLVTSIEKDGTLTGPDYGVLTKVCSWPDVDVIAAGGIGCLNDISILKTVGVNGVVIGKALYEGIFNLSDAIKVGREI